MIEFRIKINYSKGIDTLNKFAPTGKAWRVDTFTGEWWIKIKTDENTPRFNDVLLIFLDINDAVDTLKIKDCSTSNTLTPLGTVRPTLFN